MFAIGWLELKDFEKADKIFKRSYAHIQEPFKTWSEVPDGGGAYNFITGMGGFLQTIIFGYAGIRIYSDHLEMNPVLPYETNNFVLHGVHYLGSAFMLEISDTMVTVTRTTKNENSPELHLVQNDKSIPLSFEKSVSVPREKLIIQP
uniref:Acid trehalase-like protein 1-like n=1 Tax=Saccoglossus kowalevskii TaxID=10224 RepID=A0ABM0MP07_SACKO|nr:PREDICTED: acid trehalase-like protein 1-like [Saccoglossus kowalevskii]